MISRTETDPNTFITQVIWSNEMSKLFEQLRGNQYEINGLLTRLFMELKAKQDDAITKLGCQFADSISKLEAENKSLRNRIADLEAMK